jgi:hypothetical protein
MAGAGRAALLHAVGGLPISRAVLPLGAGRLGAGRLGADDFSNSSTFSLARLGRWWRRRRWGYLECRGREQSRSKSFSRWRREQMEDQFARTTRSQRRWAVVIYPCGAGRWQRRSGRRTQRAPAHCIGASRPASHPPHQPSAGGGGLEGAFFCYPGHHPKEVL